MKTYRVYTTLDILGKKNKNVPKFIKAYNREEAWNKAKLLCSGSSDQKTNIIEHKPVYLQYFHK